MQHDTDGYNTQRVSVVSPVKDVERPISGGKQEDDISQERPLHDFEGSNEANHPSDPGGEEQGGAEQFSHDKLWNKNLTRSWLRVSKTLGLLGSSC